MKGLFIDAVVLPPWKAALLFFGRVSGCLIERQAERLSYFLPFCRKTA